MITPRDLDRDNSGDPENDPWDDSVTIFAGTKKDNLSNSLYKRQTSKRLSLLQSLFMVIK